MAKRDQNQNIVIEQLIEGYQAFHQQYFAEGDRTLYQNLARKGQSPKIMIVACSDSRVDPAIILNCLPGEAFVVRNVANLVPPCENDAKHHGTSAALEFATCFLGVEHIIVFGHSQCGGIRALLSDTTRPSETRGFISSWMDIADDAKQKALAKGGPALEQERSCCEYSLIASLKNLHTFPWIAERVQAGNLALHAWYFELETGDIKCFNAKQQKFENLV